MKNTIVWIKIASFIIIVAGCIFLSIKLTPAVINSNMPLWLKIMLLK